MTTKYKHYQPTNRTVLILLLGMLILLGWMAVKGTVSAIESIQSKQVQKLADALY